MNFYYHPILGLQYNPVYEIVKGDFNWDPAYSGKVIWIANKKGVQYFIG